MGRLGSVLWGFAVLPLAGTARHFPGAAAPKFCLLYGEGYGHVQTARIAISENPFWPSTQTERIDSARL